MVLVHGRRNLDLEQLAYWYFRLNGCLTIPNFIVHPDHGRNQETDVDVIAVRFPHRRENLVRPMKDDDKVCIDRNRIQIFLGEAKRGRCDLNGPWTNPERGNVSRVISAIGPFRKDMLDLVAKGLYADGRYRDSQYLVSLFCLGESENPDIRTQYPDVPQVLWSHVGKFIFERMNLYRNEKRSHGQWDDFGRCLYDEATRTGNVDEFLYQLGINRQMDSRAS